jgi:hypothetical protein
MRSLKWALQRRLAKREEHSRVLKQFNALMVYIGACREEEWSKCS